ncbi:molybdopterin molybdotransferase MoeA [Pelodictyon luteolum]|uniref:Molybdopterin molybdenumtransferase n=1 Tax=Chlorobium luteolum (strain DSM 273 / BCRC 81028 / 2530) TaxID=319225 RepID=Q3B6J2_CHLL3|nr:gephyrin-like molybdotransferase Glp [Pelodictyon luteolum]ABB23039.1 molybdopterin molybdochelatase [Pelodictyon luteolum DSM 273]
MLTSVDDARRIVMESLPLPLIEECRLNALQGRVLAGDVAAPFPMPRFTNSAMDGFAFRIADAAGGSPDDHVHLPVSLRIPAGSSAAGALPPGSAAEIMTGAPMPEGADTVVPFENTSGFGGDGVEIYRLPKAGANVRYRGEEIAMGQRVLDAGRRISPSEIAVLASFGIESARVWRLPSVALVVVGDELQKPGGMLRDAAIYDSNSHMLRAACRSAGIEPVVVLHAEDDPEAVRKVLAVALATADVTVTSGGISTGEYDFVQEVLTRLGVEKKFWSVSQKPGKPFYFGCSPDGKVVFALPGNPVSSLVCFTEYCVPALMKMQGLPRPAKLHATLDAPFPADRKRHRFLPGVLREEGGRLFCRTAALTESHMATSLVGANCLIESPPADTPVPAGDTIACSLLPWASLPG